MYMEFEVECPHCKKYFKVFIQFNGTAFTAKTGKMIKAVK